MGRSRSPWGGRSRCLPTSPRRSRRRSAADPTPNAGRVARAGAAPVALRPMPESRIRLRDATIDDADLLDSWETLEALGEFNYFGAPKSSKGEALAKGPLRDDRN